MWLTWIAILLMAVLSGLGVGSAGLPVIWLTMVEKLPQLTAQGLNLAIFLCSSGAALVVHLLRTPLLYGCILLLLPGGICGCFLGAKLTLLLPEELLRRCFGGLLVLSGALGLFGKKKE